MKKHKQIRKLQRRVQTLEQAVCSLLADSLREDDQVLRHWSHPEKAKANERTH